MIGKRARKGVKEIIIIEKRKITKILAASSNSESNFDCSKIKTEIQFTFQTKENYLKTIL